MIEVAINSILSSLTEYPVSPVFGTEIPCITYSVTPQSGGVVKRDQVEVRIIDSDLDNALETKEEILKKLDMTNRVPSLVSDGIALRSELAGGGTLFNDEPQAWEVSIYLIITWRRLENE